MKNEIDGKALGENIRLPYVVPVDFIVRTFILILIALMLFGLVSLFLNPKDALWYEWGFLAVGLLFSIYVFVHPSGLSIDEDGITKEQNFVFKKKIKWDEIEKVTTGTQDSNLLTSDMVHLGLPPIRIKGTLGRVSSSAGPYLMIFKLKEKPEPFLLNIKPYTKKGLGILVHFIAEKALHATLDESTRNVMKGIMPQIFFRKDQNKQ